MSRRKVAASNTEWRQWGDTDPFFGVASWRGRERGGTTPWTPEAFYALGRSDWADFHQRWAAYGLGRGRCLDLGCGAGRLTAAMAADFDEVIGVDVSEGMLKTAREHVRLPNVTFVLGDGVSLPVDTVDAVFSAHVFQHLDSLDLALANFAEIARVLRPDGTMLIHLPMYLLPPSLPGASVVMRARRWLGDLRAGVRRRSGQPLMRGLSYDWTWLREQLPAVGLTDVECVIFPMESNGAHHTCILARRTA